MNRNVMLALLSLDSYNRDYDSRIALTGTQLGTATILDDSGSLVDENNNRLDEPAGFYALAYNWNGEKIISYRGTDNLTNISDPANDFWSYGIGAGDPYNMTSTSYGTTVGLAATF